MKLAVLQNYTIVAETLGCMVFNISVNADGENRTSTAQVIGKILYLINL